MDLGVAIMAAPGLTLPVLTHGAEAGTTAGSSARELIVPLARVEVPEIERQDGAWHEYPQTHTKNRDEFDVNGGDGPFVEFPIKTLD
ncbi:hypothetical protein CTA1_3085 [Colletotrichum tanaceti]|uniref:Uncharacterized protein n=1 Tax=Colletotrichum tanaceti TaxID=1306861 RepID=A0A4U6XQ77_9PEZI|nr:hypothetical protein CTA1_3085 [Colletotrichum tanaceti]